MSTDAHAPLAEHERNDPYGWVEGAKRWTCPNCGRVHAAIDNYCYDCDTNRPITLTPRKPAESGKQF